MVGVWGTGFGPGVPGVPGVPGATGKFGAPLWWGSRCKSWSSFGVGIFKGVITDELFSFDEFLSCWRAAKGMSSSLSYSVVVSLTSGGGWACSRSSSSLSSTTTFCCLAGRPRLLLLLVTGLSLLLNWAAAALADERVLRAGPMALSWTSEDFQNFLKISHSPFQNYAVSLSHKITTIIKAKARHCLGLHTLQAVMADICQNFEIASHFLTPFSLVTLKLHVKNTLLNDVSGFGI